MVDQTAQKSHSEPEPNNSKYDYLMSNLRQEYAVQGAGKLPNVLPDQDH